MPRLMSQHSSTRNVAEEAFRDAKAKFSNELSKDARKVNTVNSSQSIDDVRRSVTTAMEKYSMAHKDSKVKQWLVKLSERIQIYGGVLDVFAQHHPEYVALAWGSIKFLLTV